MTNLDPATLAAAEQAVLALIPTTFYAGDVRLLKRAATAIRKLGNKTQDETSGR